ncbi:hypothetical protein I545_2525 [Mycobacterium kansasii 662]|uniref:Uncharacterized protein n=2 Tax=Mycobacterium kansasii TaxID=1768 RepID=A0A1V3WXN3_MYCKA|nr:hypothetical protein I545_2525 [Mycobacterium kansasii 662]OOK71710.1 hypothetical protein BZL30_5300 [Mycobacterium kansasii]
MAKTVNVPQVWSKLQLHRPDGHRRRKLAGNLTSRSPVDDDPGMTGSA